MATNLSIFFVLVLSSAFVARPSHGDCFNVLDHGAVGDGLTDDTQAFLSAWQSACMSAYNPTMEIPSSKTFLLNPLSFEGPCVATNVHIELNGKIIAPSDPSEWVCDNNHCDKWIHFKDVDGLTINGSGTIDGRGQNWWNISDRRRPSALQVKDSNDVRLSGLRFKNNPQVHVVFDGSTWVHISNLTIQSPESSPNTDGIHFKECKYVHVDHCRIGTGDDCISIVDGSSYLNINNIMCGPGHGISIGSLGKGGSNDKVEYVHVSDVEFRGATNGARIKTWQGGQGYARHIKFERITSFHSDNPIIIDQFYCDHQNCKIQDSAVRVSNVTFSQIKGTSRKKTAVKLACSNTVPCRDIFMDNISIRASHGGKASSYCNNAYGRLRGEMDPIIPCLI